MATRLLTHPACLEHVTPPGHPERVDRLKAINKVLAHPHYAELDRKEAPLAGDEDIARVHTEDYIRHIRSSAPDPDQEWARGEIEARAVLVREPPEARSEGDHDEAPRDGHERGLER